LNVFGIGTTLGTGDLADRGSTLIGRGGIDARAGVSSSSPTGNATPTSASLDREAGLRLYLHYGLHSQTQYIPTSMVEGVEVIDSNASAEYGGFQGGVVQFELIKPSRESKGQFFISR